LYHELVRDVKALISAGVGMDHAASCVVPLDAVVTPAALIAGCTEKAIDSFTSTASVIIMLIIVK
jgi:hypothetical protein